MQEVFDQILNRLLLAEALCLAVLAVCFAGRAMGRGGT